MSMTSLLCLPALVLTVSPLWLKPPKLAKVQLYALVIATLYAMISMAPDRARVSAPFNKFPQSKIAFFSCSSVIPQVQFCPGSRPRFGDYSCVCQNENALATFAYCYEEAYPQEIGSLVDMCNRSFNTSLDRDSIGRALERYHNSAKNLSDDTPQLQGVVVDFPVKLSEKRIVQYRDSYDQFLGNYNRSMDYGWYMVVFWSGVFLLATLGNWSKVLLPGLVRQFTGPRSRWIRSKITLPALSGKERTCEKRFMKVLDYLPPTRAESLIVGSFTLFVIHLSFYKIHFVPDDPIFGTKLAAYMRCFAVRTGIISSALLPLSVLFAGRNNVLQWITKWEYSTFVMFHRWISRVMVLLLIVHTAGYSPHLLLPLRDIKAYVLFGAIAFSAGLAILVQGMLVLRRKWYEAFLAIHIVLAAAFLAGAWLHVQDLHFLWYFYVSACLWVYDRLLRVQRLCVFGFPTAEVKLYEDDTLKFRVPIPSGFKAEGGGHCFVHFLHWSCFWQSHPFTYTVLNGKIIFYVKVKKGVTARLKRFLENHPNKAAHIKLAVEGSYGEATPATRYDSSVFLAGGNGIPGIYAEAVNVARQTRGERKVKLIWVVREYTSVLWFFEELQLLQSSGIDTEIYVTRPQADLRIVSDKSALLENTYTHQNHHGSIEYFIKKLQADLPHVSFRAGRPNIEKIVELNTDESFGSTCFVTCGHPVMVDDVRWEVARKVAATEKRVDYFEQLQVWA
ncbi:hypothetical protein OXX69_000462 [Metschnikowia pulcherrima]